MKKLSLVFLYLVISAAGFAQGFYFRTGLGYAIPQAGQTLDGNSTPYHGSFNSASKSYSIKGVSFSAGVQAYAGFGYMVNKHVGVQAELNACLVPRKYTTSINDYNYGSGVEGNIRIQQQALLPVFFDPSIVIQSGGDKLNIYSRFGPAVPLNSDITYEQIQVKKLANVPGAGTTTEEFTFNVSSNFSVGLAAAAGVEYKIGKAFSIWGEFSMLSFSAYTKRSELTSLVVNGTSYQVPVTSIPPVNYTKNGVIDSNGTTQMSYSQPFSNFSFNVGIRIAMSRKSRGTATNTEGTKSKRPAPAKFH